MLNWHLANEMTPETGVVLLVLNLGSVIMLLVFYVKDIKTYINIALKRINLFALSARFRLWRSAHNARH